MGVIKRQGIKNSIISYFGVLIGALNVLFIYPLSDATLEAYGLMRFLIDTSFLLLPFVLLGMNSLSVRFFPTFKTEDNSHNGFLPLLLLGASAGMFFFVLIFFLGENIWASTFSDKKLIAEFFFYLIPFTCLMGLVELLTPYISNFHRIVVPAALSLLLKITMPAMILLFYFHYIDIDWIVKGVLINLIAVVALLFVYLKSLGQLNLKTNFKFLNKGLVKEMGKYAAFGVMGTLGSILATRIDTFMVGTMLGEMDTGVYAVMLFMAGVIDVPRIALSKITSPIVADSIKNEDLEHVEELYKKTSITLLILGGLLFIGILTNLKDLFTILPGGERFIPFYSLVFVLCIARLVDAATSINHQIIAFSKYFKFNFYAILFMSVFNIIANIIFIPKFNILGAAMATLFSLFLYNLIKGIYVYRKFKMHPFSQPSIWVLLIGAITFLLVYFIPSVGNIYLDMIIKTVVILLVYGGAVLYFRLSPDVNNMLMDALGKLPFKKWKK